MRTLSFRTRRRWMALAVAVPVLALAARVAGRPPTLVLVNESPSLPEGLYLRAHGGQAVRGAIVAVPQPGEARPYLAGLGMPAGALLLKRVAASGGETVCRAGPSVWSADWSVAAAARDRRAHPLPAWSGCRVLAADELFLLGDTAASFDSRYFGPVDRSQVTGVFREVLRW